MRYDFDQRLDLRSSDCDRWRRYTDDVIPLWVADMDFVSPQPVIRTLQERVAFGVFGYPEGAGVHDVGRMEMRQTIVDRLWRLYRWQVEPDEIVFVPGVVPGLNLACHAVAEPGAAVLVQPPVYNPFLAAPQNAGMARLDAQLTRMPDGSYEIDYDALSSTISDQTRLFILCNPHNPVGRVFRRDELLRLAEICLQRGVLICSDEIHCDLVYCGYQHIPIASLDPEIARSTITLMAPSKTFNIPGLQFSFAVIQNAVLREKYKKSGRGLVGWINTLGWVAAQAAYQYGQEWLEQVLDYLQANRDFLFDTVQSELPGVSMANPEATYLAWLDCRNTPAWEEVDGRRDAHKFFLQHARVALSEGATFGVGGEGFVRLNYGCPRSRLEEALERMKQAIKK
jgi:cystathionine beta-lyase